MTWLTWPARLLWFLLWFGKEVLFSNLAVMHDVFTVEQKSSPVVVRFRTRCRGEFETALLSVLITLTPGTLTLATTSRGGNGRTAAYDLYVHVMYENDPDRAREGLRRLETRMLHSVRVGGGPR